MRLRDKYFNKETGEIRIIVLVYRTKSICGLALESSPSKVLEISEDGLKKYWEKYEDHS